jgi:ferredoxin
MARLADDWPARRNPALARRLRVQGIIAEAPRLRVLLDPMGVHPVFIRIPVDADRSIGCGVCPQLGQRRLCCDFNVLDLMTAAPEGVSACPEAASNEVSFKQHPAENCIAECSKCLFVVACRNM